jgi:vitamin B12 transporter
MALRRTRYALAAAALASGSLLPALATAQATTTTRPEEIVVTSSRVPTPRRQLATAVSVIDGADVELRGYHDLGEALRTQPGVGVSNSGGMGKTTTLRIRGEEGFRTLLVIDGVKALDATGPQVAPSFDSLLATSDIERIEILRGPQGFLYGADAGGVVNVLTARGAGTLGGRIGLEYGDYATRKLEASLSGGGDTGDYFVSATDIETDGFNSRTADTVLADNDGAENTTLHAKLGWNVAEDLRLQLVVRDVDAATLYDGCFSPTTFATLHDCSATTAQTTYKVAADYEHGDFRHSFGWSRIDVEHDNFSAGVSAFATEGEIGRFEYTGVYRPSATSTLVYGADLQAESLNGDRRLDRDQDGYYVEYQRELAGRIFISAGARYDDNEDFGAHTSARLAAAYHHDLGGGRALKYRTSLGTGFRAPSLLELAYNNGPFAFPPAAGTRLIEESSTGYDLGIEYDTERGLHLEGTYFDQEIDDEIFFDLVGFSGYLQSRGTSSSKGLELGLAAALGERFEILANWTHNDTMDTSNAQRLRRPEDLANVGVLFRSRADALRVIVNYRLARDAVDIGGVQLDDYAVLDLSLAYALSPAVEIHARVQNAADEQYQEIIGYNSAGRSAYAGLRWRFR